MRFHGRYLQIGDILIPRPRKITESGDRAFINEENSIHVTELLKYVWWNKELLSKVKAATRMESEFETIVHLLGNLSRLYEAEGADQNYLRDKMWEDVATEKVAMSVSSPTAESLREYLRNSYTRMWEIMWDHNPYELKMEEEKEKEK